MHIRKSFRIAVRIKKRCLRFVRQPRSAGGCGRLAVRPAQNCIASNRIRSSGRFFGRSGRSPAGAALFPHRAGVSAEGGQFRFGQVSPRRSVMPTVVVRSAVGACGPPPMPGAAVRFSPPPHSSPAPCVPVRMGSCGAVCRLRLPADFPAAASGVREPPCGSAPPRIRAPRHASRCGCGRAAPFAGRGFRRTFPPQPPVSVRESPCGSAPPPAFVPRAMRPGADAVVRRRLPAAASGGPSRRSTSLPDVIRRTDVFRWPESRQRAFPPARLCVCCVCALRCGAALRSRPDRGTALPVGEPVSAGPSCRGAVYRGRRREAVRRVFRPPP